MARSPAELLQRARVLVPEKADWFRALLDWHANYKTAKKILQELGRCRSDCWLTLTVNGQPFVKRFHVAEPRYHELSWIIPPDLLRRRNNEIHVAIDRDSTEFLLASAAIAETPKAPRFTLDLATRNPRPLSELWLPDFREARHRPDQRCWGVSAGGSMTFGFSAPDLTATHFIVNGCASQTATISLDDVLDEVMKAVEAKEKEIRGQLDKLSKNDPQATNLEIDLDDLKDYKRFHKDKVEPAFAQDVKAVEVVKPVKEKQYSRPTGKPAMVEPRPTFLAGLGKLLVILIILGVGGSLCYSAWKNGELNLPFLDELTRRNQRTPEQEKLNQDITQRLQATGAKTGDVQISLIWYNKNDLDLHVVAPSGETVFYANRQSKCGGQLDVDMNVNFVEASDRAVENVYWKNAPAGHYKVYVNHFTAHNVSGCEDPTAFAVRVANRGNIHVVGGNVVNRDAARRRVLAYEFDVH